MRSFETWFRDFFLCSLRRKGEKDFSSLNAFSLRGLGKDSVDWVEQKKFFTRLSWLFGSVLYLSGFAFCCWILAFSVMHLTLAYKNASIIEKIFFFASPNTWKKYLFPAGGLFGAFRSSKDRGEYVFIFLTLALILSSLLSLIFSLLIIHIASGKNLKELRLVSLPLCFPVFGWVISCILILHFFSVSSREKIERLVKNSRFFSLLFGRYFGFLEHREINKGKFKPKKSDFLDLKAKEEKLSKFPREIDRYIVKKI